MNSTKLNAAPEVRCITVVFQGGRRKYDYKSINPDIKGGDAVIVEVKCKKKIAFVVSTSGKLLNNPPFEYKWILGTEVKRAVKPEEEKLEKEMDDINYHPDWIDRDV